MATYTSAQSGNWETEATWGGGHPVSGDTVTILNSHVITLTATQACAGLTINTGGQLWFDGQTDTVPAILNLDNGATIVINGAILATGTGAAGYAGINGVSFEQITTGSPFWGINHWHLSQLDFPNGFGTGGFGSTITLDGDIRSGHNFTVSTGDVFNAGSYTIEVAGNFISTGTFNCDTSTVVMTGTGKYVSGTITFWNFTKAVTAADTLTFIYTGTSTFGGTVTLTGVSGQLLSIVSSSAGNPFGFVLSAGAVKSMDYLSVKDSDASGSDASQKPIAPTNSVDVSGNTDWFAGTPATIRGMKTIFNYYY